SDSLYRSGWTAVSQGFLCDGRIASVQSVYHCRHSSSAAREQRARNAKLPDLPVEVGPLNAKRPGGLANSTAIPDECGLDQLPLEAFPRFTQRVVHGQPGRTVEAHLPEDILDLNDGARRRSRQCPDGPFELRHVAGPWQCREQLERGTTEPQRSLARRDRKSTRLNSSH